MAETVTAPNPPSNSNAHFATEAQMLREVFPPDRQPSTRWLRERRRRKDIPFIRIRGMTFYDVPAVRAAITKKFTVRSKHDA